MQWYEQNFVNHRDWILDNLAALNLTPQETVIALLIDFMNEHHMDISIDSLASQSGMKVEEVNQTVSVLCARHYLDIRASSKSIRFLLNGLFETDTAASENVLDSSLFDVFEAEFGRPLSPNEMQKISEWNKTIDRRIIIKALREASTYQRLSLPYIEKILLDWKKAGVSKSNAAHEG